MSIFNWFKKKNDRDSGWKLKSPRVKWYPSNRSCIKQDMTHVRPQQMPPLMVRKAAWRR